MPSILLPIQAGLALAGVAWKLGENLPAYDLPPEGLASYTAILLELRSGDWTWPSILVRALDWQGVVPAALVGTAPWPWFVPHWAMYVSQMAPIVGMMAMESVHQRRAWAGVVTVILLALTNPVIGLSSAMPLTSIVFLALHRLPPTDIPARGKAVQGAAAPVVAARRGSAPRRLLLLLLLVAPAAAHIGLWAIAILATLSPSLFTHPADHALHVMNSLAGVPPGPRVDASDPWTDEGAVVMRIARLRQINEMVGTSSGFFAAVALLCDALAARGRRVGVEAVLWMFLVSLVAGPAAGCASVLLARDWVLEMA